MLAEPRSCCLIVYSVAHARNYFNEVLIEPRMFLGKFGNCLGCILSHDITSKTMVHLSCTQRESDIRKVLHRSILQRLPARHWARTCKIIRIERSKTLATVATFGYTIEIDSVGIDIILQECQAQQFLPSPLLALYSPAVELSKAVGYLRYEVQ